LARPVELHAHQTILVDHATPDVAVLKRILCAARRVTLGDTLADLADRAELLARDAADYLGTLNRHLRNVDLRTRLPCQAHRLTTCLSCLERDKLDRKNDAVLIKEVDCAEDHALHTRAVCFRC